MIALIDGDILTYSVGFATEGFFYMCGDGQEFKYKKEAVKYCEDTGLDVANIQKMHNPEPVAHALHSVKILIESVVEATKATEYRIYLTGENNFRERVATILPYKGNRTGEKPTHYQAIRDYLVKHHDAIVINNMEADDAMGVAQCKEAGTVICSKDKDMMMIPGWHYNWQTGLSHWVNEFQGAKAFYTQLLTGDKTDNIQGLDGIGDAKAAKILASASSPEEMYEAVEDAYLAHFPTLEDEKVRSILFENGRLLWIGRSLDEQGNVRFDPPGWGGGWNG